MKKKTSIPAKAGILIAAAAFAVSGAFASECPLCDPAKNGDIAEVNRLLADGANPNAADSIGVTTLMRATIFGHAEVAKVLLTAGANPNAASDNGRTALMVAASFGHAEIVKMLLAAGANPNVANDNGNTALMFAELSLISELTRTVLERREEMREKTKEFPFLKKAETLEKTKEYREVVQVLKELERANPNAATNGGKWSKAERQEKVKEYQEIVRMLKEAGAKE